MILPGGPVIVGHVLSGPLDALVELGLPLVVFAALWWWSTRKERSHGRKDKGPRE